MNKSLKISLLILTSIFLFVGCSQETPKEIVEDMNIYEELNIPTLEVTTDGTKISVEKGSYSWDTGKHSVSVDAANWEQIAEKMEGTKIVPQSELILDFSKQPNRVSIMNQNYSRTNIPSYTFADNKLVVPEEEGTYVYEIIGGWVEGEISFTIKVIVSK